jgi:hypothetical protein
MADWDFAAYAARQRDEALRTIDQIENPPEPEPGFDEIETEEAAA